MATDHEEGEQPAFEWEGRRVVRAFTVDRDRVSQVQRIRFDYRDADTGEPLGSEHIAMRWTWRYELEHLLARCGFEPFRWSSGYDGRPYTGVGDIVVVARRA